MRTYLDFEKQIAELENKIEELKALAEEDSSVEFQDEIAQLERRHAKRWLSRPMPRSRRGRRRRSRVTRTVLIPWITSAP